MAMAFEALGISPIGDSLVPAQDRTKGDVAYAAGKLVVDVLHRGLRPRDIITRDALENAIATVTSSGGSTNGVLHLLAVAREMGIELSIDDFDRISDRTPLLCDLKPGGRYVAVDLYEAGGVAVLLERLRALGVLHEDAITVTGKTIGEIADSAEETDGQRVVRGLDDAVKPTGGLAILRGNLAPEGCVVKLAGHERRHHTGPARVFEGEEAAMDAVTHGAHRARATSSSSATRARPAARACARCSRSPRRSTAQQYVPADLLERFVLLPTAMGVRSPSIGNAQTLNPRVLVGDVVYDVASVAGPVPMAGHC